MQQTNTQAFSQRHPEKQSPKNVLMHQEQQRLEALHSLGFGAMCRDSNDIATSKLDGHQRKNTKKKKQTSFGAGHFGGQGTGTWGVNAP